MKVHLVDGTFELFRTFYGAPSSKSPSGDEVGATRGLLRTLLALVRDEEASHVGVAFDTVIESFRNDLFDGYKTGAGIDPDLWAQFPLAERAAEALGMTVWRMREFEADDALATAAARFSAEERVEQVCIASPDKDLMQCVRGDRVVLLDRLRKRVLDEKAVVEKLGVEPPSIPDYLALVGDSADGIPGIRGWGAKSSATLLRRYRHIESIPDDESSWDVTVRGAARLGRSLRQQREEVSLYKTLATLRTDVPLPEESLDDLAWHGADRESLKAFSAEIGDGEIIGRVPRWRG